MDRRYAQARLLGEPDIRDDRATNRLFIRVRYRIANLFERLGDAWSLRYEASNLVDVMPGPNEGRRRNAPMRTDLH